jgi:hypothetical protein
MPAAKEKARRSADAEIEGQHTRRLLPEPEEENCSGTPPLRQRRTARRPRWRGSHDGPATRTGGLPRPAAKERARRSADAEIEGQHTRRLLPEPEDEEENCSGTPPLRRDSGTPPLDSGPTAEMERTQEWVELKTERPSSPRQVSTYAPRRAVHKRWTLGPYEEDEDEDSGTPPLDAGLTAEMKSEEQCSAHGNASLSRRAVTVMPIQRNRAADLGDDEEEHSASCNEEEDDEWDLEFWKEVLLEAGVDWCGDSGEVRSSWIRR